MMTNIIIISNFVVNLMAQVPLYLQPPSLRLPVYPSAQLTPTARLQCSPQCMPSCLPSCALSSALEQQPPTAYQPYSSSIQIVQSIPSISQVSAPQPTEALKIEQVPSGIYEPYNPALVYYPLIATCAAQCMPTCAPQCLRNDEVNVQQNEELPTPPPEVLPTQSTEETTIITSSSTTTKPISSEIQCKCLIKITITQGSSQTIKCHPNSCLCPIGYDKCGNNCCKQ